MTIAGVVTDYDTLRAVMRTRRQSLGWSQLELDERAGLQTGYTGKIEAGIRNFGAVSLPSILGALGLVLVPILRPTTYDQKPLVESGILQLTKEKNRKEWGSAGGKKRALLMSPKERSRLARKAIKARWKKQRELQATLQRKAGPPA